MNINKFYKILNYNVEFILNCICFCSLSISNIANIHKLKIETYYNIIRYNVVNLIL